MISRQKIRSYLNGNLLLYKPPPPLSPFVNHIWYASVCDTENQRVELFLPNGSMDLVINLADVPEKISGPGCADQNMKNVWVSGLQTKYVQIQPPAGAKMMGIEFKPGGAYPFFGFAMSELRDRSVDLDLIWGRAASEVREAILESKSVEERFGIVESFLLRRLQNGNGFQPVIAEAILMISGGSVYPKIRIVAGRLGMPHKHMIDLFNRIVGVTPKVFSRICRFQRALQSIPRNGSVDLTTVAVSCDYFDQPHFIREFEEFSGLTPGEYLRVRGTFPGWLSQS